MALTIDHSKCVGCGLCVSDCLQNCLAVEDGHAVLVSAGCILCGHCAAICPAEAVSIPEYRMDLVEELAPEDLQMAPERLQRFLSGRRSIRRYQKRPLEQEKLEAILETGRMSPTGGNRQNVRFVVLQQLLPALRDMAVETLYQNADELSARLGVPRYRDVFMRMHEDAGRGEDRLFFGAPAVIVAIEQGDSVVNGALAASRMELMAAAQGLGVCYIGFFSRAAELEPRIRDALRLEEWERIAAVFAVGYPDVSYRRTAPRKDLRVEWL